MGRVWLSVLTMLVLCGTVRADSTSAQGTNGLAASASVDFRIVVPEVLALRVSADSVATGNPSLQHIRFDPAQPVVRGARAGLALDVSASGASNGITLRSNMRQITVTQESGSRTSYIVATP